MRAARLPLQSRRCRISSIAHDQIFLVEQNRDAQMRSLLVNECGIDPARFISVLHYDGTPITAALHHRAPLPSAPGTKSQEAARMTYIAKPKLRHPGIPVNKLGFTHRDYEGSISTLCAGCGHDSISFAIIQACFELNIEPHRVAKLSGIGCSSKTPDYLLGQSHGFNSVHGRMPSVLTGANLANRELLYLGISGDGDSASIGLGQFVHCVRRGVNMVYITENNGVYGLTKGQFSATADKGSKSKAGGSNLDLPLDLVSMALMVGASFVGRSFSRRQGADGAADHGGDAAIPALPSSISSVPASPSTTMPARPRPMISSVPITKR